MEINKEIIDECNKGVENVAIFIDFDNIYYSLRDYGVNLENDDYCIFTLMNKIYTFNKIRTMRAYADYDQIKVSFKKLKEKRVQIKNVYGNGKEESHRKNASDIELSIDALDAYYRNSSIDTFVFITSDSDMIPIMSRLIFKGKKVHLYYIENKVSHYQNLTGFNHVKNDLAKLFKLDEKRLENDYWKDQAIKIIKEWYNDEKNKEKSLGGKWLNDILSEKLFLSSERVRGLIDFLVDNKLIEKKVESKGYSYIIQENNS